MPEVFTVSDVDEAIELATYFRDQKRFDWFRGQTNAEWLPHTSLMRVLLRDESAWETVHRPRVVRFYDWVAHTPGLSDLASDNDAIIAIAQHYGLPTHYLDFTTD